MRDRRRRATFAGVITPAVALALALAGPAAAPLASGTAAAATQSGTPSAAASPSTNAPPTPTDGTSSTDPASPGTTPATEDAETPTTDADTPVGDAVLGLSRLDPRIPAAGDTLVLAGTLRNTSGQALRDVEVRLWFRNAALRSVTALDATSVVGSPVSGIRVTLPGDLLPGATATWQLPAVALDRLGLASGLAVYPLTLEARAGTRRVATLRTALPWTGRSRETAVTPADPPADGQPAAPAAPAPWTGPTLGVAIVWPLAARPTRGIDGTFNDDTLATALGAGRLGSLLSIGQAATTRTDRAVPVSWAVDPATVDRVRDMSDGYDVTARDGRRTPGTGAATARTFMAGLPGVLGDGRALVLPYGAPDVAALGRASDLASLPRRVAAGTAAITAALGRPATSLPMAWPADGAAPGETLRSLRDATAARTLLLSDTAVSPVETSTEFPIARATTRLPVDSATGSERVPVVRTDTSLSTAATVATSAAVDGGGRVAEQRVLSETALLASIGATQRRAQPTAVIAGDLTRFGARPDATAQLVADLATAPWITPVHLADVAAQTRPDVSWSDPGYPPAVRAAEVPGAALAAAEQERQKAADLSDAFADPNPLAGAPSAADLVASSTLRGDPRLATSAAAALAADVARVSRALQVEATTSDVTLTSSSGMIQVSISNSAPAAATVRVRIEPDVPNDFTVTRQPLIKIDAGRRTLVDVPVTVNRNGPMTARVALETPDGTPIGTTGTLRITSTAYGTVALGITLGAGVLLVILVARRLWRRTRPNTPGRRRRTGPDPGPPPRTDEEDPR